MKRRGGTTNDAVYYCDSTVSSTARRYHHHHYLNEYVGYYIMDIPLLRTGISTRLFERGSEAVRTVVETHTYNYSPCHHVGTRRAPGTILPVVCMSPNHKFGQRQQLLVAQFQRRRRTDHPNVLQTKQHASLMDYPEFRLSTRRMALVLLLLRKIPLWITRSNK